VTSPGRIARVAVGLPVVRRSIDRLAARDRGTPDLLAVLTYHRVDEPSDQLHPGLISATPRAFEEQVAWLARSYRVVSLADVVQRQAGGPALPRRSVLLTFDDGYRDFADHAWPALLRLGVPATLFVPTAFPGDPGRAFWWDRLHRAMSRPALPESVDTPLGRLELATPAARTAASRRIRTRLKSMPHDRAMAAVDEITALLGGDAPRRSVLDWDELRALVSAGLEVGAHTRTHPLLDRIPEAELDAEIGGSRLDLERELGHAPVAIAYPNGNHSAEVRAATAAAGFTVAFTTRRGTNDLRAVDWLALRRVNVGGASDRTVLAAQLHRWFQHWP